MLGVDKKRSTHRLSSMFSVGPSGSDRTGSVRSTDSNGSRFSKLKHRVTSYGANNPGYPPPSAPKYPPSKGTTIQPVASASAAFEPQQPLQPQPPPAMLVQLEPLRPPPPINSARSRSASPGRLSKSRPGTASSDAGSGLQVPADSSMKKLRRRSKLFGGGEMGDERAVGGAGSGPLAWVVGHKGQVEYNLTMLLNGEKVPELWDEQGDTLVYLFPRTSSKGPSFRIDSSAYAASRYMTRLLHGTLYSEQALPDRTPRNSGGNFLPERTASPDASAADSSDGSKGSRALSDAAEDDHSEKHLYMPIALTTDLDSVTPQQQEARLSTKDIDTLITYRNFVAFLVGQSLVATPRHSDIFDIFIRISDILQHYNFSNVDGSSYGEVAASSFDSYVDELNLADVRQSREKTIEAIILGEKMRSIGLYTEGFVHGVGKYDSIKELNSPKWGLVSSKTATRMARAALDLDNRELNINTKLKEFEFPAMFAGLMASDMANEKKMVRFRNWKSSFMNMRSFAIDYYKTKYGSWLPRARSKKNNLTTNGLNRLVLVDVYRDLSDLYDMLVDRTNLTQRTADGFMSEDERTDFESVASRALRKVLSEYDRSTPPVQPPIPFDIPLYPTLKGVHKDYPSGDPKKDAKARGKKLSKDEIARMIKASYNPGSEKKTSFLDAFRAFERKQAAGCTMQELWELRAGQWLFLYAVIQSLPLLVADAPRVKFTEGVEYFLCEVPRSGAPWAREDTTRTRTWFGVAGGSHVVSLPTDVVEHGVEGVFRRSHCWKMAEQWAQNDTMLNAAMQELNSTPLPPPTGLLSPSAASNRSRSQSPDRRRESVMDMGLEALPLPPGIAPAGGGSPLLRPASAHDPSKTFDSILGSLPGPAQGKDKKKKK